ncbi:phosphodiester glycosidase family protein [Paenibacillus harenae]|uniref:Phosphodiester glycosidase domain-containing protein n=1 Tax=Paenibacillus harenae TaxID=306543 RepID=A0ABT9TV13_PAEHA|nr:phosphodiester glycosidase family protein [Paenibacillus harenae]MDQ0111199.1 hypothetical protein [Paenibacillus harenae]
MDTPRKSRRKLYFAITAIVVVIGILLYALADRYLIEKVEIVVRNPQTVKADSVEAADPVAEQAEYDEWNYKSDEISISIDQVQTGTGADMITYFVADVRLSGEATLSSAFAKNSFGRNVIDYSSSIAQDNNALFAINGDYYGFRDDGVIIRNGTVYRDEPARIGLGLFEDGTIGSYDETEVSSSSLLADGVVNTLSFGPVLIQDGMIADDLSSVKIDTNFGNRSIQGANPRTGIGMIAPNHYVFVVVDGRKTSYSKGMTLDQFAQVFADLGATEAYNLDGGGSSTMYFMGRVVNNPQGKNKERGVSDILYIAER